MTKKWALWAGAAIAAGVLLPSAALAQNQPRGPFTDVPMTHWAYDAVNSLAQRGIFTGYPDNTFGGRRALTRYEFAIALQRLLQDVDRRIASEAARLRDASTNRPVPGAGTPGRPGDTGPQGPRGIPGPPGPPGTGPGAIQELQRGHQLLRSDFDRLQRLATEFSSELAMLGADVEQLKRNLQALADRVTRLEENFARLPKITGAVNIGFRGASATADGRGAPNPFETASGTGFPGLVDRDGRLLNPSSSLGERINAFYDIDLGITASLSEAATARLLLNAGNYLRGYLGNRASQVSPFMDNAVEGGSTNLSGLSNFTVEDVVPYYLYIETPAKLLGIGTHITAGKFGHQFTPYTLRMVDVDSYFTNDKTDLGDYPITGGRARMRALGLDWTWYAGTHPNEYAQLSSTAGFVSHGLYLSGLDTPGEGAFFGVPGGAVDPSRFNPHGSFGTFGFGYGSTLLEQSAGVRATWASRRVTIGGTYLVATGSQADFIGGPPVGTVPGGQTVADLFRRLDVYGVDFNVRPFGALNISGAVTESKWSGQTDGNTQKYFGIGSNDRRAWDIRGSLPVWKVLLSGFYKRIGDGFDAPGAWGRIGNWINPRGIEGFGGGLEFQVARRFTLDAEIGSYNYRGGSRQGLAGSDLIHARLGLRWPLSGRDQLEVGYEMADYDRDAVGGLDRSEQYWNLGLAHQFNSNLSWRVFYQLMNVDSRGILDAPGFDYKAHFVGTQFQARF